ncbi:Cytochrome P450 [Glarea lozoyensis ATCC 20868]|uniref:Cytochrome P450 monooxygenase gloO n=1 Tax=Glarea lozoyensis (strain ATCC 20868 / MF5171) TaxID=1116229 RepID=GLOO_GLAL2|nr:Cytochrome P450 [Glarea lozoyensis ATCC 20868]S3D775.1 RecName: Full=Cytochrome P450 monooxygenase gloO; AltName: Full=Ornithine 3,4-hydroxylase; AltName: Full=Pneumocandin biosynthesis cluster protein O; Flags: Precursor [Glarea lozoyensis ATCC 20868]EPE34337.1 Cytochrome P450 [Glarea lozoyensis ATCC 20868]
MIAALFTTNLQLGAVGVFIFALLAFAFNKLTTWEYSIPKEVQWVDRRTQPFSYLRAKARALARSKENTLEAYFRFNKLGKAAALAVPFGRPLLLLPQTFVRWIVDQPESIISLDPIHDDFHVFVGGDLTGDHTVQELLRRELTLNLDKLISVINDEIVCALDDVLGNSPEWKSTSLADDLKTIVARTSNRVFVGKDLCRNKHYISTVKGLALVIMPETVLQDLIPQFLKGPLSRITKAFNNIYGMKKFSSLLLGVVRQRYIDVKDVLEGSGDKTRLPDDLLTWMVQKSIRKGESSANIDKLLVARIAMANLAAIETTTAAMTRSVLDLVTQGSEGGFLKAVQEETLAVVEGCNYEPSKKDVLKLVLTENAIKEALRLQVAFPGLMRQVVAPNGVTLENGLHVPCGTRLGVSAAGIHVDESIYEDPTTYNPGRFLVRDLDPRGDPSPMWKGNENYLAFSLGRRSCPGRWYVTDQLKLTLAHIFSKYEIRFEKAAETASALRKILPGAPQDRVMIRRRSVGKR